MTNSVDKIKAKALITKAATAANELQDSVRELVTMRAWTVLGYESFAAMWKAEAGFDCPKFVKILAVLTMVDEGVNTRQPGSVRVHGPDGHTNVEISQAIGYAPQAISTIISQRAAGVPAEKMSSNTSGARIAVATHGTGRARQQARRVGKNPNELVHEGFMIIRRDADRIADVAADADVPKSEIYRQAIAEYLARLDASKK